MSTALSPTVARPLEWKWVAAASIGASVAGFVAGWLARQQLPAAGAGLQPIAPSAAEGVPEMPSAKGSDEDEEDGADDAASSDWDSQDSETEAELALVPERTELKMVFAVRQDLNLSKGKACAQVGHAVLGAYKLARFGHSDHANGKLWRAWARAWDKRACAKITLKVDDEAAMFNIAAAAEAAGLPYTVVEDAGRTEIPAGTRTVIGIGPAPKAVIDAITGPKGKYPLRLLA
jgi:PTH2 family peptidyl-tRNA hydrolase